MEQQFQILFDNMKIEMHTQMVQLKESLTNSIMEKIDEQLKPIIEENKDLKEKLINIEKEMEYLKREKKQNNIIIFGLKEEEDTTSGLIQQVKKIFNNINVSILDVEINNIYRIGRESPDGKPRPVLLSFVNLWKKNEVMKARKNLKDMYIAEDYSKEVLEKRKMLQNKLKEERQKGNFAYLKYDKLVVKENNKSNDKRKREISLSSRDNAVAKKQQVWTIPKPSLNNRRNAFDVMRGRSNSLSADNNNKQ